MADVTLAQSAVAATLGPLSAQKRTESVAVYLTEQVRVIASEARSEGDERGCPADMLPLVRLRVDMAGLDVDRGGALAPARFGHALVGVVANPAEVLHIVRRTHSVRNISVPSPAHPTRGADEVLGELVAEELAGAPLSVLSAPALHDALQQFVSKDERVWALICAQRIAVVVDMLTTLPATHTRTRHELLASLAGLQLNDADDVDPEKESRSRKVNTSFTLDVTGGAARPRKASNSGDDMIMLDDETPPATPARGRKRAVSVSSKDAPPAKRKRTSVPTPTSASAHTSASKMPLELFTAPKAAAHPSQGTTSWWGNRKKR